MSIHNQPIVINTMTTDMSTTTAPFYHTMTNGTGVTISPPLVYDSTYNIRNNTTSGGTLQVKGDAEFEGDVKLKGKSINKTLEKIEERLAILHPNTELEEKWERLRGLRKMYMELEQEIIEKEKMWDILKK